MITTNGKNAIKPLDWLWAIHIAAVVIMGTSATLPEIVRFNPDRNGASAPRMIKNYRFY
jgi:hypothetical protein